MASTHRSLLLVILEVDDKTKIQESLDFTKLELFKESDTSYFRLNINDLIKKKFHANE